MAGYHIYSLDADVFQQLTTTPTIEQCLILAKPIVKDLGDLLEEYEGVTAADAAKWPRKPAAMAESIQQRLSSQDWFADFTLGDVLIWNTILRQLDDKPGEKLGIDFQCENDGFLYWDAAKIAAQHGAPMMAEPKFGNSRFRYFGRARDGGEEFSFYVPAQVQQLLQQLELAVPHFETLPEEEGGDRDQFFDGLLEPVRKIAAAGRVMWVQTDT